MCITVCQDPSIILYLYMPFPKSYAPDDAAAFSSSFRFFRCNFICTNPCVSADIFSSLTSNSHKHCIVFSGPWVRVSILAFRSRRIPNTAW